MKQKRFKKANETLNKIKKIKNINSENVDAVKDLASLLVVDIIANDFVER